LYNATISHHGANDVTAGVYFIALKKKDLSETIYWSSADVLLYIWLSELASIPSDNEEQTV
jgi:hypothetical protein